MTLKNACISHSSKSFPCLKPIHILIGKTSSSWLQEVTELNSKYSSALKSEKNLVPKTHLHTYMSLFSLKYSLNCEKEKKQQNQIKQHEMPPLYFRVQKGQIYFVFKSS